MKKSKLSSNTVLHLIILGYLTLYGIISFLFLEDFPLVHSDEAWLSGLTRNMMENGSFSVTEAFFDARPRYPHAIKILFHGLQMAVTALSDYSIRVFRLISLLFSLGSLYLFSRLAEKLFHRVWIVVLLTILLSFDIQFIYSSHMARQESILLFLLLACLCCLFRGDRDFSDVDGTYTIRQLLSAAILTGIAIGVHPNSFLLACMVGCMSLCNYLQNKEHNLRPLLTYIGVTGAFAALFIAISYSFDSRFLTHYFSNGASEFGIDATPADRFSGLLGFFSRLFHREGGTYFVADIRLQLILFSLAALLLFFFSLTMKKEFPALCSRIQCLLSGALGLIAGIFIIGRYSQLSIVFLFPLGWIFVFLALELFEEPLKKGLAAVLLLAVLGISYTQICPYLSGETYEDYLTKISAYVEPSDKVIGNLNMDYYFENGALTDYRNLPYVIESDGNLDSYIEEKQIAYIFYTDELTYYFEHRPYYNALYGNIMFAQDLLRYCEEECDYLGSFESPRYAPRILELLEQEDYATVRVYRTR